VQQSGHTDSILSFFSSALLPLEARGCTLNPQDSPHNTQPRTLHTFSRVSGRIMNGGLCCGVLRRGRAAHVWVKYVLVLQSHVLPDSMVTNPSRLPIFPLYLVLSGRDYTGLDSLPEADMHSFIKNSNAACSHASNSEKCTNLDQQQGRRVLGAVVWLHQMNLSLTSVPRLCAMWLCNAVVTAASGPWCHRGGSGIEVAVERPQLDLYLGASVNQSERGPPAACR